MTKMSIKTDLFSFRLSVASLLRFLYYRSLLYYRKFLKKLRKNKKKLRIIYPKNHENFKNSKPRVQVC